MTEYYTGIGSRSTPSLVKFAMKANAAALSALGLVLRSGGADGADTAFEEGSTQAQIFLPWQGFNGRRTDQPLPGPAAEAMAAKFHPAWDRCSAGARKLHARNCYQVLGPDLATPSLFVLCWTPGGEGGGGTGQAIRIARAHDIPVFDMAFADAVERLYHFLKENHHD